MDVAFGSSVRNEIGGIRILEFQAGDISLQLLHINTYLPERMLLVR